MNNEVWMSQTTRNYFNERSADSFEGEWDDELLNRDIGRRLELQMYLFCSNFVIYSHDQTHSVMRVIRINVEELETTAWHPVLKVFIPSVYSFVLYQDWLEKEL